VRAVKTRIAFNMLNLLFQGFPGEGQFLTTVSSLLRQP